MSTTPQQKDAMQLLGASPSSSSLSQPGAALGPPLALEIAWQPLPCCPAPSSSWTRAQSRPLMLREPISRDTFLGGKAPEAEEAGEPGSDGASLAAAKNV